MSHTTALVVVFAGLAFITTLMLFGKSPAEGWQELGIECVKSGGQWISSWDQRQCVLENKK